MYFLSNVYRIGKLIIASVGLLVGGGVLIYGAITAAPIFAVGGGFYFVTSLLLVFDSSKVLQDIKKEINRMKSAIKAFQVENQKLAAERVKFEENNHTFSANNEELKMQIEQLDAAEGALQAENESLAAKVEEVQAQLIEMDRLKAEYETENKKLQTLTKTYDLENQQLKDTAQEMATIQVNLKTENEKLNLLLEGVQAQLIAMEKAKRSYEEENTKYRALLQQNEKQLQDSASQINAMKQQIEKLRELHENSKQLIRNLVDAGDMFTNFSTTLGQDVANLDNVTGDINEATNAMNETIKLLNMKLTEHDFDAADVDGDGQITEEEWKNFVENKN